MNKRLLTIAASALVAVGAMAQGWERPVPTSYPRTKDVKASIQASDLQGDTTIYYLLNVDAPGFLNNGKCTNHAPWDTHARLNPEQGLPVMVVKYVLPPTETYETRTVDGVEVTDTIRTEHEWDGSYKILDLYNGAWHGVFADNTYNTFVDRASQPNYLWYINPKGDGTFTISLSDLCPINSAYALEQFGSSEHYMGLNLLDPDYVESDVEGTTLVMPLTPLISALGKVIYPFDTGEKDDAGNNIIQYLIEDAKLAVTWAFLDEATYNQYRTDLGTWDYAAQLADYVADVKAQYPRINSDELAALVNSSTPVSREALENAYNALQQTVHAYRVETLLSGASDDDPRDATSLMTNADLSAGNVTGWTLNYVSGTSVTNLGYQGASYSNGDVSISNFIEAWANAAFNPNFTTRALGDGSVYQIVKGLPAGKYAFTCDAIAVTQDNSSVPCSGAYLYAKSGDKLFRTAIHTGNNAPEHFRITFVNVEEGDFELGFMTENTNANWLATDNFTLTYYGETTENAYQIVLNSTIDDAYDRFGDIASANCNAVIRQTLLDELENAGQVGSDASLSDSAYIKATESLTEAVKAFETSVSDYVRFNTIRTQLEDRRYEFEASADWPELAERLGDLQMEWDDMYDNGEADAAYIANAQSQMTKVIVDYITENVQPGSDVTPLIINGDFNDNFSHWSYTGARPAFGGKGGNGANILSDVPALSSGNAEVFQAAFDMYQYITGMPKGSYTLTAQVFQRNDNGYRNDWAQGPQVGITTFLYANEMQTPVHNILAFAQEEMVYQADGHDANSWPTDTYSDGYGYTPNSMDGANFYFNLSPETYLVKTNFFIEEDGDSIRIGVKTTGTKNWVIFDNFRLIYNGESLDAFIAQVEEMEEQVTDQLNSENQIFGFDARDMLGEALTSLGNAKTGSIVDCMEAINQAKAALEYTKESQSLYSTLMTVYEGLLDAQATYEETAKPENLAVVDALIEEVENTLGALDKTNAEVSEMFERARLAVEGLKPFYYYVDLTEADFYEWTSPFADAEKVDLAPCSLVLNATAGGSGDNQTAYGNVGVVPTYFADLSNASVLKVTVQSGIPRLMFNRLEASGERTPELPRDDSGYTNYWSREENVDGTVTFLCDLKKIVDEVGFAHLHAIKAANWGEVYIVSLQVGYDENNVPSSIDQIQTTGVQTTKAAAIYTVSGTKTSSVQRGINIVRSADGTVRKVLVR